MKKRRFSIQVYLNFKEYCLLMPLVKDLQQMSVSKSKLIKRLIANAHRQTTDEFLICLSRQNYLVSQNH